jgi:hypothetical protein
MASMTNLFSFAAYTQMPVSEIIPLYEAPCTSAHTSFEGSQILALVIDTIATICYTHHIPMTQMIRKHFLLPLPIDERIKLVARRDH